MEADHRNSDSHDDDDDDDTLLITSLCIVHNTPTSWTTSQTLPTVTDEVVFLAVRLSPR